MMAWPHFVLPFEPSLIAALRDRDLVVVVERPDEIRAAVAVVQASDNRLDCVVLRWQPPLDALEFVEDWVGVPLVVEAVSLGKLHRLSEQLDLIRRLELRVDLPLASAVQAVNVQMLASLGIPCRAVFGEKTDWDAATDLMTYALLGRCAHAPIEPFAFIAEHVDQDRYRGWGEVSFDQPDRYLHVDRQGRVALFPSASSPSAFLHEDLRRLGDVTTLPAYQAAVERWRRHFLHPDDCARCPGWKLCRGQLAETVEDKSTCSAFFSEMLDVAEQYQTQQRSREPKRNKWLRSSPK